MFVALEEKDTQKGEKYKQENVCFYFPLYLNTSIYV